MSAKVNTLSPEDVGELETICLEKKINQMVEDGTLDSAGELYKTLIFIIETTRDDQALYLMVANSDKES